MKEDKTTHIINGKITGRFLCRYILLIGCMEYLSLQPAKSAWREMKKRAIREAVTPIGDNITDSLYFFSTHKTEAEVIIKPPAIIIEPKKEISELYLCQLKTKSESFHSINIPEPDNKFIAKGYIIVSTMRIILINLVAILSLLL